LGKSEFQLEEKGVELTSVYVRSNRETQGCRQNERSVLKTFRQTLEKRGRSHGGKIGGEKRIEIWGHGQKGNRPKIGAKRVAQALFWKQLRTSGTRGWFTCRFRSNYVQRNSRREREELCKKPMDGEQKVHQKGNNDQETQNANR